ncbi:MAG: nucleotide exchange factor GrpE [Thermoplasmata archaeon]
MPKEGSKGKRSSGTTKKELEAKLTELREELSRKEENAEELLSRLAYLQAELENLRKRWEKERQEFIRFASTTIMKRLLPVVDEFELALNSMKKRDDDFVNGVRMIYDNLMKILQAEGLQEIKAEGELFDPYLHEALDYVEEGGGEGRIVKVVQKGYRLEDRILRPSQVVVSRREGEEGG